ncbi:hypothetical protein [Micromonospora sp. SL4-19]|uniref:hypothetical protein n=1 Tax=Micromonospora sp. SL4-19 TaxID=3399129 RepID=UPI003A4D7A6D
MGKSAIQSGKRAAVECKPGGHCYDGENRCVHCREHIADPHQPDCPHADEPDVEPLEEPDDECDARPAEPERVQAFIELRGHGGLELVRRAVETLQEAGFDVAGQSVNVFRKGDGLPEWIGVVTLPERV